MYLYNYLFHYNCAYILHPLRYDMLDSENPTHCKIEIVKFMYQFSTLFPWCLPLSIGRDKKKVHQLATTNETTNFYCKRWTNNCLFSWTLRP